MADPKYIRKKSNPCAVVKTTDAWSKTPTLMTPIVRKMKVNGVIFNKKSILAPLTEERKTRWR